MRKDLFQCSNLQETGCRAPGEVCAAVVSIPRPRTCRLLSYSMTPMVRHVDVHPDGVGGQQAVTHQAMSRT